MEGTIKINHLTLVLILILGSTSILVVNSQHQTLSSVELQSSKSISTPTLVSVQTTSGLVNGIKQNLSTAINNNNFGLIYKFLSVPYAKAPIGELRFKKPIDLDESDDNIIIDASKYGKTCPQFRHLTRFISPLLNIDNEHQISEDCLTLNIFVPSTIGNDDNNNNDNTLLEPIKKLPVIVWLPGEGFDFADARQFDGSQLASKTQSIVVTVQYRVGIFGFLHAPKLGIDGNMGLHDQLSALRWIKRNILQFGGDSSRVTLMGRFSGSMSISALITAPNQNLIKTTTTSTTSTINNQGENKTELLFNKVAMLSGIAVEDWIISKKQADRLIDLKEKLIKLKPANCNMNNDNDETLLKCLKKISVDELLKIGDFGWRLVIDNELIGQFDPIEAIKRNQFASELESVLIGETGQEGTLCLYRHLLQKQQNNFAQLIENDRLTTNDVYDIILDDSITYFGYNITKSNPIQAALETIVEEQQTNANANANANGDNNSNYLQQSNNNSIRDKYLNACSAYMIKSHSNRFKRNLISRNEFSVNRMDSKKKPVEIYHYEFKYKPTFSLAPDYIKTAAHGDDIPLIFGLIYNHQSQRDINEADLLMTKKMMSYIGNFVHGNNPLLSQQHKTIQQIDNNNIGNETITTIDGENSLIIEQQQSESTPINVKRNWSSEGQIYQIDFNDRDLIQLKQQQQQQSIQSAKALNENNNETSSNESKQGNKQTLSNNNSNNNLRVLIVEKSPQSIIESVVGGSYVKTTRSIIELVDLATQGNLDSNEQQQQQLAIISREIQAGNNQQQSFHEAIQSTATTKSQRLLELHRQQLLEENLWTQQSLRKNLISSISQQQQQQQFGSLTKLNNLNESSFLTMLIFCACIVIITFMSLCIGLCLVIFKNNLSQQQSTASCGVGKGIQHFTTQTNSCNICDDSHTNSLDGVLDGNSRKDGRGGFNNVFAKLRNHNNPPHHQQPQSTSTSASNGGKQIHLTTTPTIQSNNVVDLPTNNDMVVMHQSRNDQIAGDHLQNQ